MSARKQRDAAHKARKAKGRSEHAAKTGTRERRRLAQVRKHHPIYTTFTIPVTPGRRTITIDTMGRILDDAR